MLKHSFMSLYWSMCSFKLGQLKSGLNIFEKSLFTLYCSDSLTIILICLWPLSLHQYLWNHTLSVYFWKEAAITTTTRFTWAVHSSGLIQRSNGAVLPFDQDFSSLKCWGGVWEPHGMLRQRGSFTGHRGPGHTHVWPWSVWLQNTYHLLPSGTVSWKKKQSVGEVQ